MYAPGCPASVLNEHSPGRERQDAVSVFRKYVCRTGDSGRLFVESATWRFETWREELSWLPFRTWGGPVE